MLKQTVIALAAACLIAGCTTTSTPTEDQSMITHSVFFKLKHDKGSDAEQVFLTKAAALSSIPGVGNYQILEEVSPKNEFDYGLSMEFADQAAYDGYNTHPEHVAFVQEVWLKEVADFQEIDYISLNQ
ncbi:Dabb family protein [Pontiellaceae bacterium B12227]|nr:Dabb family protein [Pontiellaceae bacterium B12227]